MLAAHLEFGRGGSNFPEDNLNRIIEVNQSLGFYSVLFTVGHGQTDFCAQAGQAGQKSD